MFCHAKQTFQTVDLSSFLLNASTYNCKSIDVFPWAFIRAERFFFYFTIYPDFIKGLFINHSRIEKG